MYQNNDQIYFSTLSGIIDVATKFQSGEWDAQTVAEYGNTMKIRSYIPFSEKIALIVEILNRHLFATGSPEFITADIYKDLFFYGLLQAYGLVDCRNSALVTYENYDLLYPLFYPYIIGFCKDDYAMFKEMLKDSINVSNVRTLIDSLHDIDEDALKDNTAAIANMLSSFKANKGLIEDLSSIATMNDPNTAQVVKEMQKMAVDRIKQNSKKEKE